MTRYPRRFDFDGQPARQRSARDLPELMMPDGRWVPMTDPARLLHATEVRDPVVWESLVYTWTVAPGDALELEP